MPTTAEQTALQLIQAQADDMIDRAHRHFRGPFRLGVPACVWRRAGLPRVVSVTTKEGHHARCVPIPGVEFQSYVDTRDPWAVIADKVAQDLTKVED